jgi:hypothetical protein
MYAQLSWPLSAHDKHPTSHVLLTQCCDVLVTTAALGKAAESLPAPDLFDAVARMSVHAVTSKSWPTTRTLNPVPSTQAQTTARLQYHGTDEHCTWHVQVIEHPLKTMYGTVRVHYRCWGQGPNLR